MIGPARNVSQILNRIGELVALLERNEGKKALEFARDLERDVAAAHPDAADRARTWQP